MTDKQKALFRQLQIVVLGLVIGVGGLIADHTPFVIIGICVFIFGTIRCCFFWKLLKKIEDEDIE